MSVKIYDKQQKKWVIFPGTMGAPGKDAYTLAKENGYTGTKEEYNAAITKVPDIVRIVYGQHSTAQLTSNVSIFETGVNTRIVLYIDILCGNERVVPETLELSKNNKANVISTDVGLLEYDDTINTSTTYYLYTYIFPNVLAGGSIKINSYYPLYYGASSKQQLVSADVLRLVKQPIKASPAGNVSIPVRADNQYIWLCVPSTMKINKVTSSGFDVPMNEKIVVNVDGKTSYNCYRSAETFIAGTFNGIII